MRDDPDQASVRVELDGNEAAPGGVPEAAPASTSRLPLIGGLLAVALVVVLVVLARPNGDDGIAGGPETQVEESAPSSTTTTASAPAPAEEMEDHAAVEDQVVQATDLGTFVGSMAPAARGWIALESFSSPLPRLFRSTDGLRWTSIDATFDFGESDDPDDVNREFFGVTATDTGFAMLMVEVVITPVGPQSSVHRLTSEFGADWQLDASFEMEAFTTEFVQPIAHQGEWVQLVEFDDTDAVPRSPLSQLLAQTLVDPDGVGDACFARATGSALIVETCTGSSEPRSLVAVDFQEPERFEEIANCAVELITSGPAPGLLTFITRGPTGEVRRLENSGEILSIPALLADGTVVLLDGGTERLRASSCVGFLDEAEFQPPRLVVWPPNEAAPRTFPLEIDELPPFFFAPAGLAAEVPDGVRMVVGTEVWEIDLVTGTVESLFSWNDPVGPDAGGGWILVLLSDGSGVVVLEEQELLLVDIDTGERRVLSDTVAETPWAQPVAVSGDEIFVHDLDGRPELVRIDLTKN